jgi:hypothetical protein
MLTEKVLLRMRPSTRKDLEAIASFTGLELATLVRYASYRLVEEFKSAPDLDKLKDAFRDDCVRYRLNDGSGSLTPEELKAAFGLSQTPELVHDIPPEDFDGRVEQPDGTFKDPA